MRMIFCHIWMISLALLATGCHRNSHSSVPTQAVEADSVALTQDFEDADEVFEDADENEEEVAPSFLDDERSEEEKAYDTYYAQRWGQLLRIANDYLVSKGLSPEEMPEAMDIFRDSFRCHEIKECVFVPGDDSHLEPKEYHDEYPRPFRFTVRVCKSGQYAMPLVKPEDYDVRADADYRVRYDLDCDGDGIYEKTEQSGDVVCDLSMGLHHIAIRGTIPGLHFDTGQAEEVDGLELAETQDIRFVSLDQWGDNEWRNLSKMFDCFPNDLIAVPRGLPGAPAELWNDFRRYYNAKDAPNLKRIRKLHCIGGGFTDYRGSFAQWDVSQITDMSYMFRSLFREDLCDCCKMLTGTFNQDISGWDTSRVTNMEGMFKGCRDFNQPIQKWNTSEVTNMRSMFWGTAAFNQPIGSWNTSRVTDMRAMFYLAQSFNQPLQKWNTSRVVDMSYMFDYAEAFDQPVESWNITSVKNMDYMFYNAESFGQRLSSWNVKNIRTNCMMDGADSMDKALAPKNYAWKCDETRCWGSPCSETVSF